MHEEKKKTSRRGKRTSLLVVRPTRGASIRANQLQLLQPPIGSRFRGSDNGVDAAVLAVVCKEVDFLFPTACSAFDERVDEIDGGGDDLVGVPCFHSCQGAERDGDFEALDTAALFFWASNWKLPPRRSTSPVDIREANLTGERG